MILGQRISNQMHARHEAEGADPPRNPPMGLFGVGIAPKDEVDVPSNRRRRAEEKERVDRDGRWQRANEPRKDEESIGAGKARVKRPCQDSGRRTLIRPHHTDGPITPTSTCRRNARTTLTSLLHATGKRSSLRRRVRSKFSLRRNQPLQTRMQLLGRLAWSPPTVS